MLFALVASALWIVNSIYSIGYMRANHEPRQTIVLRLLRGGARQHDRHRLRQEPVHAVPVLRDADARDLSAGDAQGRRRGDPGRPRLSPAAARHLARAVAAGDRRHLGSGRHDSTSRPAASWPARPAPSVIGVLLALYVFGIGKAAVMPLHLWLPAAMVAPTPVSALLHAVAVVKAGVFASQGRRSMSSASMRCAASGQSAWLTAVAGTTILAASHRRAEAGQPEAAAGLFDRLAALLRRARGGDPGADLGGRRRHAHRRARGQQDHAVLRGRLDLHRRPLTEVSELDGIGRRMPWTMGAFAVGALGMIGMPPTAGFLGKWFMLAGAMQTANGSRSASSSSAPCSTPAISCRSCSAHSSATPASHGRGHQSGEAPWPIVLALTATAAGTVLLFFCPRSRLRWRQLMIGR